MSTVHHTKLQVNGPSGHCSHLDFHSPPEVQQPSPVRMTKWQIIIPYNQRKLYPRCRRSLHILIYTQYLTFNSPPLVTPPIKKLLALIILYLHIVFGGHLLDWLKHFQLSYLDVCIYCIMIIKVKSWDAAVLHPLFLVASHKIPPNSHSAYTDRAEALHKTLLMSHY